MRRGGHRQCPRRRSAGDTRDNLGVVPIAAPRQINAKPSKWRLLCSCVSTSIDVPRQPKCHPGPSPPSHPDCHRYHSFRSHFLHVTSSEPQGCISVSNLRSARLKLRRDLIQILGRREDGAMLGDFGSWLNDPANLEVVKFDGGLFDVVVVVACSLAVVKFSAKKASGAAGDDYVVNPNTHMLEALGFLKDWVTSIIQIETALLGGIGAAVVLKDTPDIKLNIYQSLFLLVAAIAFSISIYSGIMLLNMLPGAAQRVPNPDYNKKNDIYSIYTEGKMRLYDWTKLHRNSFFAGLAAMAVFVLLRVIVPNGLNPERGTRPIPQPVKSATQLL